MDVADQAEQTLQRTFVRKLVGEAKADLARLSPGCDNLLVDIARGEGQYLYDSLGQPYLDFSSVPNIVGHNSAVVSSALAEQMRLYTYSSPWGDTFGRIQVEYLKKLASYFPEGMQIVPCSSETAAAEIARYLAGGRLHRAVSLVLSDGQVATQEQLDELIEHQGDDWLIIDESRSGFGRTGKFLAQEHFTFSQPPVTVLGGAVAAGMPMGVIVGPPEFFARYSEVQDAQAGHPLCMAAAMAVLAYMHENMYQQAEARGAQIANSLVQLVQQFPFIEGVRGPGLLLTMLFNTPADADLFRIAARDSGVLLGSDPLYPMCLTITPPICISEAEVHQGMDALFEAAMKMATYKETHG